MTTIIKVMIYFNKNQAINFKHVTLSDQKSSGDVLSRRATVCQLVDVLPRSGEKPSLSVISEGVALCDSRDNFKKENGRKIALKKALDKAKYTRDQRTIVWNTYFNR